MNDNYKVYIHKFPDKKVYVGLTKQSLSQRWNKGNGYKNQPLYKYILKFGWDNIEHILIKDNLTFKEAQNLEKELIIKYDSINNGYNSHKGGGLGGSSWVKYEYNGQLKTPEELAEISNIDGLTGHDITTRVNFHNWSLEKAIETPKLEKTFRYEYKGNTYTIDELLEISSVKGLTNTDITNRINQLGWSVERAITQPKNVKKQPRGIGKCQFEYNGKLYNSFELEQISKLKGVGIPSHIITNRINAGGWTVEESIIKPLKVRDQLFKYKNKLYTSKELASMSKIENLTHNDITDRINRAGWSVEKAITTPKRKFTK